MSFVFERLLLAVQRVQGEQSKIVIILVCEALAVTFGEGHVTQRSSKRKPHNI